MVQYTVTVEDVLSEALEAGADRVCFHDGEFKFTLPTRETLTRVIEQMPTARYKMQVQDGNRWVDVTSYRHVFNAAQLLIALQRANFSQDVPFVDSEVIAAAQSQPTAFHAMLRKVFYNTVDQNMRKPSGQVASVVAYFGRFRQVWSDDAHFRYFDHYLQVLSDLFADGLAAVVLSGDKDDVKRLAQVITAAPALTPEAELASHCLLGQTLSLTDRPEAATHFQAIRAHDSARLVQYFYWDLGALTYFAEEELNLRELSQEAAQIRASVQPVSVGSTGNKLAIGVSMDPNFFRIYSPWLFFYAQQLPAIDFNFFLCASQDEARNLARDGESFVTGLNTLNRTGAPKNVNYYHMPTPEFVADTRTFYACARFFCVDKLVSRYENAYLMDADLYLEDNPTKFFKAVHDIIFGAPRTRSTAALSPWRRYMAGNIAVSRSIANKPLLADLQAYLVHGMRQQGSWMLDQNGLSFAIERNPETFTALNAHKRPFLTSKFMGTWEANFRAIRALDKKPQLPEEEAHPMHQPATNRNENTVASASTTLTVADLDMGVSERQAIGSTYAKAKNIDSEFAKLQDGKVTLRPHPAWEGDYTDWAADPYQDRNWRFQHHTLRWLNPLKWAALEGDEDARAEWIRIVKSWADANIPAELSPSDFAWKDMADGNRAVQLSLGAPLVGPDDQWFVELLEYHRDWLMDPEHIVGKNHGLHQHIGLLVVAAALRDSNGVDTAVTRLREQFVTAFDEQGGNDEGSAPYHQMNLVWWKAAWDRVKVEGIEPPTDVAERLEAAALVLAHLSLPNGQVPQIGDGGRVHVARVSEALEFVASSGLKGTPPEQTTMVLDRGYVVSRSGWGEKRDLSDESHTVIRHGKDLRAHSHSDRGSVHVYAAGQRWLVDSGFHSYQKDSLERTYLNSRDAHNVASIIGLEYKDKATVELVAENVDDQVHDFTLVDHGYGSKKLTRRVVYLVEANCWIVADRVDSETPVRIDQRWHLEPGVSAQLTDKGFHLAAESKEFEMQWAGDDIEIAATTADDESLDGWIGTEWRKLSPSTRLTAKSVESTKPRLVSVFGPHSPTQLSIVELRVESTGKIFVHVSRGTWHWEITIDEDTMPSVSLYEYSETQCPVCGTLLGLCECTGYEEPDIESILIGGRVCCALCGTETSSRPCPDHQPREAAEFAENQQA